MRQVVRDNFLKFSAPLEGRMPVMYCDVRGLVTFGVGNLIDPIEYALKVPWLRDDGSIADQEEIVTEWHRVKNVPDAGKMKTSYWFETAIMHVTDVAIDAAVMDKVTHNDMILSQRFPGYEFWPADAQLATLSMSWALGPYFKFPKWQAAALAKKWGLAALECFISEAGNPGLKPRNAANKFLFLAALTSTDPNKLDWGLAALKE